MRLPIPFFVVLVVSVLGDARASADESPSERHSSLNWVRTSGAESCVAAAPLARSIEERLERSVFVSAADAEIAVEGRAERDGDVFRAVLVITEADGTILGERTLESHAATCDELGEMVAVTVALMIDPLTAPTDPQPEPTVVVRTERVEVPVPSEPARRARRHRIEVDATLAFAAFVLPTTTVGGQGTLIARPPSFVPLVIEGAIFPFSQVALASGGDVRFVEAYAGLAICPLWKRIASVELHGCVGLDAGAVVLTGATATLDETERLLGQARASMRVHWDVRRHLTLRGGAQVLAPFRHAAFTADGGATRIYEPDPVGLLLDLGLGVHFP